MGVVGESFSSGAGGGPGEKRVQARAREDVGPRWNFGGESRRALSLRAAGGTALTEWRRRRSRRLGRTMKREGRRVEGERGIEEESAEEETYNINT